MVLTVGGLATFLVEFPLLPSINRNLFLMSYQKKPGIIIKAISIYTAVYVYAHNTHNIHIYM